LKKLIKNKNIYRKFVNNQTINAHILLPKNHNVSKEWLNYFKPSYYQELIDVYKTLDNEFTAIDVVDLIYYERWLNV